MKRNDPIQRLVLKSVKDANPKVYGYPTLSALIADETRFTFEDETDKQIKIKISLTSESMEKDELNTKYNSNFPKDHFWSFKDADGDVRYIPVSMKMFITLRNDLRKEEKKLDKESRCLIPYNYFVGSNGMWEIRNTPDMHKGYKKCMCKCSCCPYYSSNNKDKAQRTGSIISLNNKILDSDGNEAEYIEHIVDEDSHSPLDYALTQARKRYFNELLNELKESDKKIVLMRLKALPYSVIAKELGKSESTVQERGRKLLTQITEKINNYFE